MNKQELLQLMRKRNSCTGSFQFVSDHLSDDLGQVWFDIPRGDWLIRLAVIIGLDNKKIVAIASACVRTALPYLQEGEIRPLHALQTAEAWCRGEASIAECKRVADEAYKVFTTLSKATAHIATSTFNPSDAADALVYAADAFPDSEENVLENMATFVREQISWDDIKECLDASLGVV
jgi:hypothetical protein